MEEIISLNKAQEKTHDDYEINEIREKKEDTSLSDRTFRSLIESGVLSSSNHKAKKIRYITRDQSDNLAVSVFAQMNKIGYFSWIWVAESLRGNGVGTRLAKYTIDMMQERGISKVYVLPKSPEAETIFTNIGFKPSEKLSSGWYTKDI